VLWVREREPVEKQRHVIGSRRNRNKLGLIEKDSEGEKRRNENFYTCGDGNRIKDTFERERNLIWRRKKRSKKIRGNKFEKVGVWGKNGSG